MSLINTSDSDNDENIALDPLNDLQRKCEYLGKNLNKTHTSIRNIMGLVDQLKDIVRQQIKEIKSQQIKAELDMKSTEPIDDIDEIDDIDTITDEFFNVLFVQLQQCRNNLKSFPINIYPDDKFIAIGNKYDKQIESWSVADYGRFNIGIINRFERKGFRFTVPGVSFSDTPSLASSGDQSPPCGPLVSSEVGNGSRCTMSPAAMFRPSGSPWSMDNPAIVTLLCNILV